MDGRRRWPVRVAGAYAVAVLATTGWVLVASSGAEDASFAGIWLIARRPRRAPVTSPASPH